MKLFSEMSKFGSTLSTCLSSVSSQGPERPEKLTGDVLVPSQRTDDRRPIREGDVVVRGGREEPLQQPLHGVEDNRAPSARVRADDELRDVRDVRAYAVDEGRGRGVEVGRAQEPAEL